MNLNEIINRFNFLKKEESAFDLFFNDLSSRDFLIFQSNKNLLLSSLEDFRTSLDNNNYIKVSFSLNKRSANQLNEAIRLGQTTFLAKINDNSLLKCESLYLKEYDWRKSKSVNVDLFYRLASFFDQNFIEKRKKYFFGDLLKYNNIFEYNSINEFAEHY